MGRSLTRRNFLLVTGAFFAGSGAVSCSSSDNNTPASLGSVVDATAVRGVPMATPVIIPGARTVASGIVTAISQNTLTIDEPAEGKTVLQLASNTQIWDELWVREVPIEVGDRVFAGGSATGPGQFRADQLYVNVENLIGKVLEVDGGPKAPYTFVMTDRYDSTRPPQDVPHHVYFHTRTRVPRPSPNAGPGVIWMQELLGDPWPMKVGDTIQVTGRLKDGVVLAASIFPV